MTKCYGHANLMQGIFKIIVLSNILIFALGSAPSSAQTLVLNDTSGPPFTTDDGDGFFEVLVDKAFKEAGLSLELIKKTPAERALLNSNAGIDDGELARVKGINKTYTNLVRVPETLIEWKFVAFTRNPDISIRNWDDLKDYNIGYVRGWKILEKNTRNYKKVSAVRSPKELFSMLDRNRIDIALYSKWMGLSAINENKMKGIRVLEQSPLATRKMYIYLNKKHSKLVNKIAKALRGLKDNGEYQKLFNQKIKYLSN